MDYRLSKTTFNKETVLKVVYLWQEQSAISISEDEYNWIIRVSSNDFDFDKFNKELLEQQVREVLHCQFGTLRDNIYSKAFQHFQG